MARLDVLKRNQNVVAGNRGYTGFYALVNHEGKTLVVDGDSRRSAESNALSEIQVNGLSGATIIGVHPIFA